MKLINIYTFVMLLFATISCNQSQQQHGRDIFSGKVLDFSCMISSSNGKYKILDYKGTPEQCASLCIRRRSEFNQGGDVYCSMGKDKLLSLNVKKNRRI